MRGIRWGAALAAGVLAALAGAAPAHADTVRQQQWHLDALHVPEAQQLTRGDGVIVAVVDSAVDASHPDLAGQVLTGAGFGAGAPANGWSDSAAAEHGTAMAGVIAAKGGGPDHALGIAPGVKILPVAVPEGTTDSEIAQAIRWAADHNAKVINLSLAAPGAAAPEEVEAVRYAISRDVVVVAGAGNVDKTGAQVGAPANIPGVVAVSGVGHDAGFWSNSSSGPEVSIAAPAVDILSTAVTARHSSGYELGDGTSDATAIVSGTVALIRAKYPNLNAANVINRLLTTAKDQGPQGRDNLYGYGTVRPLDALTAPVPEVTNNPLGGPPGASASPTAQANAYNQATGNGSTGALLTAGLGVLAVVIVIVVVVALTRRKPPQPPAVPPYPQLPHAPPYPPASQAPPAGGWRPPPPP